jgi:predicted Zn finger-like uncharacterized protein
LLYTQCTHCDATLPLTAAKLRLAVGHVRCGSCGNVFNALVHLDDEAPALPEDSNDSQPSRYDVQLPADLEDPNARFVLIDAASDDEPSVAGALSHGAFKPIELAQLQAIAGQVPYAPIEAEALPVHDLPNGETGDIPTVDAITGTHVNQPGTRAVADARDESPDAVPDVLRADLERIRKQRNPGARLFSGLIGAVLLLAIAGQYVWFNPSDVMRQYPGWSKYVRQFCERTHCELPNRNDRSKLSLLSREVSIHPTFEGAIQVTAVMLNSATSHQTYPSIRFSLFNVNGDVIATRLFTPAEYLGERYIPDLPIEAGQGATIRLDLIAPEDTAVSFEFEFI